MQALRAPAIAALLSSSIALGCGGKSVLRSDDETASSSGGATGGGTATGGTTGGGTATGGAGGAAELGIGKPCQTDYDCLRVEAGTSSVVVCSGAGRCEIGTPEREPV